jgi:hypothetical protein
MHGQLADGSYILCRKSIEDSFPNLRFIVSLLARNWKMEELSGKKALSRNHGEKGEEKKSAH